MNKKVLLLISILILGLNSGCWISNYTVDVGGQDYGGSSYKALAYDGATTLYLLNKTLTIHSQAYKLETVDAVTGARAVVVGTGASALTDGTGTSAAFLSPQALAYRSGSPGELYVADGCVIRKIITGTWVVTTVAGLNGTCTDTDGTGTASARFNTIYGLAISGNNLYIASIYKIRKMDLTTLAVTTLAGNGGGYNDATGTAALFFYIASITYLNGNLYIADSNNERIRKLDLATLAVTTVAGQTSSGYQDGNGTSALFWFTYGATQLTSDGARYLFVSDTQNSTIRKIDTTTADVTSLLTPIGAAQKYDKDGTLGVTSNVATFFPSGLVFTPYGLFFANDWAVRVFN